MGGKRKRVVGAVSRGLDRNRRACNSPAANTRLSQPPSSSAPSLFLHSVLLLRPVASRARGSYMLSSHTFTENRSRFCEPRAGLPELSREFSGDHPRSKSPTAVSSWQSQPPLNFREAWIGVIIASQRIA
ncbi:hypothetical protein FKP32DRAFT_644034 [Trametes sanguinea]|nr:hypothetical protein FKP32DRAFT_644034 [Trametes sanguinea]